MNMNFGKRSALATVLSLSMIGTGVSMPYPALAQRAYRSDLVGQWKSNLEAHYTLRSNGTYLFTIGDKLMTNQSHSGTWSVINGHTLRLHATRRVVLSGHHRRTVAANKTFRLDLEMPDPETITLDGARFYRPRAGRPYAD